MAIRKTVSIVDLVELVNRRNKHSTSTPDVRQGWNSLLEHYLHQNGVYAGFGYLDQTEVPEDHKPGIIHNVVREDGIIVNEFPDETRRRYIIHHKLC